MLQQLCVHDQPALGIGGSVHRIGVIDVEAVVILLEVHIRGCDGGDRRLEEAGGPGLDAAQAVGAAKDERLAGQGGTKGGGDGDALLRIQLIDVAPAELCAP